MIVVATQKNRNWCYGGVAVCVIVVNQSWVGQILILVARLILFKLRRLCFWDRLRCWDRGGSLVSSSAASSVATWSEIWWGDTCRFRSDSAAGSSSAFRLGVAVSPASIWCIALLVSRVLVPLVAHSWLDWSEISGMVSLVIR
jgi:hypothetical protein